MAGLDKLGPRLFRTHFVTDWDHDEDRTVDHVMGAFYLVRGSLFAQLGGFDERFFVYLEDLDFSYRAHQAGWSSYYLASARAYHRSGGTSQQVRARRMFYALRSRILYGYKHFNRWQAGGLMAGTLLLEPLIRLLHAASRLSWRTIREVLRAYSLLYADAARIFRTAHKT
jgi:hypothetical protein